ncbi:hypothetical protein PFUGPA_00389 [Plasmodium falciparum Palo Alto/Uganda]|uniref:Uncharacterized protein n=1 Tax=Plasmodium falciparum (isolate Palo Alto / Uganda) TaxID=57270 RepID=W4J6G8_PLAFP|nr:hypothetical protein PFUGPA_00389 [Plasmodium falciparum Palo Alto/Uganda]
MTHVGHDCAYKCYVGQENSNSKIMLVDEVKCRRMIAYERIVVVDDLNWMLLCINKKLVINDIIVHIRAPEETELVIVRYHKDSR